MANCKLPTILVMHTWISYCTCVWKRSWHDAAQRGFDGTSKWLPSMGICSCHKSQSPTTKHFVSRSPHHCLVVISECFGRQRVNQLAKQPERHVISMEYVSLYDVCQVCHELWMPCSACKIVDGFTTATRGRIYIWWAIWQCCIEFIIGYTGCIGANMGFYCHMRGFIAFFLLWDDAFVFDKKNRLLRSITVHAIKRWHED